MKVLLFYEGVSKCTHPPFIIHNSQFIIMITDIVQGLKHKSKSSMFKAQSSKDKKFKAQSSKDKKFNVQSSKFKVQRIKIRSRCLNFLYIIIKEMVGKRIKNE